MKYAIDCGTICFNQNQETIEWNKKYEEYLLMQIYRKLLIVKL